MSDEKKISLEDLEGLLEEGESTSRSRLNFANIFATLVLNWQYFLFSLIIMVCGALLYLRYTEPTYKVSARLLIKNQETRRNTNQMLSNMMDLGIMTNSSGIDNEVEVLQSRILLRDVVKELKLYSEYRRKGRVHDVLVYGKQPVIAELDPVHLDSLDKIYVEGGAFSSMKLKIYRKDTTYVVEGTVYQTGLPDGDLETEFVKNPLTLPAHYDTPLGTLTLTSSPLYKLKADETYYVTILPPMLVAANYLKNMTIEPTSKLTDIAMVTLKDKNVQRGMDFLRRLADCYNHQANADKNEIALRTEEFINERMEKINAELGTTEGEIENFKRQTGMTGLSVDAAQAVQMSNQFSARLSEANSQIQMLDYLREFVNNPKNKNQIIPSNVGLTDGASTQLIASYNKAVQDRNRLLTAASESAPQVQTLTETIEGLESSIKTALLQARRSADINRQGIATEYGKYQGRISTAPIQERVLNQIGRQQEVRSGLYLLLLQKREENSISLAATADKGKLIAMPLYMGQVSPRKGMILGTAFIIGLLIPFVILFVIELLRYRIEGREDVASLTKVPIVADVPIASESVKTAAGIVVQADKNSQIDEVFRALRTNVQFMMQENEKIILFTSSISGEGKTFLAANLAVSFALLGKRVMLVGCDIRKPALGRLFGMSNLKQGLTNLLRSEHVTAELLHKETCNSGVHPGLDLLLSGPIPPNPTELLSRKTLKEVLDLLSEEYDYIILDTAPVGLVTDTLLLAHYANVCCFVCRADYTPKANVSLLDSLAQEEKLPNACVVLNGVDMSKRKYGYYYGYGRYGKYGYGRYGNYGSYGYGNYASSHYGDKNDGSIKR